MENIGKGIVKKMIQNESKHKSQVTRYRIECAGEMRGKVLDVGGGLGVFLPYFGSKDVMVLDICEEVLNELDWDQKMVGDACHLPFADNTFDSVWACSVCMLLEEDISIFIKEAQRVLKTGGELAIELPNPESKWNCLKRFLGMRAWEDNQDIKHMYTFRDLQKYGEVTGEVRFLPALLDNALRKTPWLWHTMILKVFKRED